MRISLFGGRRLTVFGRSLLLLGSEVLVNVLAWILAGLLFGQKEETRDILPLCMLAWVSNIRPLSLPA